MAHSKNLIPNPLPTLGAPRGGPHRDPQPRPQRRGRCAERAAGRAAGPAGSHAEGWPWWGCRCSGLLRRSSQGARRGGHTGCVYVQFIMSCARGGVGWVSELMGLECLGAAWFFCKITAKDQLQSACAPTCPVLPAHMACTPHTTTGTLSPCPVCWVHRPPAISLVDAWGHGKGSQATGDPELLNNPCPQACFPVLLPRLTLGSRQDVQECLLDLREHDVPYHVRFAIDTGVRAGHWYEAKAEDGRISLHHRWARGTRILRHRRSCGASKEGIGPVLHVFSVSKVVQLYHSEALGPGWGMHAHIVSGVVDLFMRRDWTCEACGSGDDEDGSAAFVFLSCTVGGSHPGTQSFTCAFNAPTCTLRLATPRPAPFPPAIQPAGRT